MFFDDYNNPTYRMEEKQNMPLDQHEVMRSQPGTTPCLSSFWVNSLGERMSVSSDEDILMHLENSANQTYASPPTCSASMADHFQTRWAYCVFISLILVLELQYLTPYKQSIRLELTFLQKYTKCEASKISGCNNY